MQIADHVDAFVARHPELTDRELEFMAQCLEVALARGVPMTVEEAFHLLLQVIHPPDIIH